MTHEPHDPNRSTNSDSHTENRWSLLEMMQEVQERAVESPDDLATAKDLLRHCLITFAESEKSQLSGDEICDAFFECVGPGRMIPVRGAGFADTLSQRIGNGIPVDDGKCQEFRIGDTWYRFRAEFGVPLESKQDPDGTWVFGVPDETSKFLGRGPSREAAAEDWRFLVHRRFQQLVRKRPFRMSETEKADWAILSELIDVEHYRKTTPIRQQEAGCMSSIQSGVCEITWLGSDTVETLSLENASPEFAAFGVGQWFEALVERNREDYSLSRVIHAQPIEPIKEMSDDEWKEWLSSLPTAESLPKSRTDWSTF